MNIKFGGADKRSIEMLNNFPHGLFIDEQINNHDEKIHLFLCKNYLQNGAALFGRRSPEEMQDFRDVCGNALDQVSDEDVAGIIQFYVQRIKNYAHLESLFNARIKQAAIEPMGEPRAAICKFYEDKIISVIEAYNRIKWFQTLTPEEYYQQISSIDFGIPPLYRDCRCRLRSIIPGVN